MLSHAPSDQLDATTPSPGYDAISLLEIMSHILLQEIKLRKELIFTVNIDYRRDRENVFSFPDSTEKAVLFFQKEQILTKMN